MRAWVYDRYGPAEVVAMRELPEPRAGRGELLVRVRAAALNPKDVLLRSGRFRTLSGRRFPKVMGLDLAGEVEEVGGGVRGFSVGDAVFGFLNHWRALRGTLSELVSMPAGHLALKPIALDFEHAAALPLAASTALQALRDVANVRGGDALLVHGASGGAGTLAIQVAKILGARVTTTSGAASVATCRALGADEALDHTRDDPLAGPRRFRVVFDVFGNLSFGRARRALEGDGTYVTTVPSRRVFTDIARTLLARRRARLVSVRPRAQDLAWLAREADAGRLRAHLDRVVPFEEVVAATRHLESRHAHGKIVVRVG
jgi:NADPH:quinone reductase-like Zn-dependent oxidoreductase